MSRLKKSPAITSLNFSGNDLSEDQDRFTSVDKFLSRNQSCTLLTLTGCKLQTGSMAFIAGGLSRNTTLERLILSENMFRERESMQHFVTSLIENPESKLREVDLSKNQMSTETIMPFIELLEENVKIRHINLRHNVITDEGAKLLVQAIVNNEYVTKLLLDMNPIRHSILADIEKHTTKNMLKVSEQEVPQMIEEILDVKKKTA